MMVVMSKWDNPSKALSSLPSKTIIELDLFTESKQKTLCQSLLSG